MIKKLTPFLEHPLLWRIVAAVVFLRVIFLSVHPCFFPTVNQLDYPIQIISVQRILHGEMPYRDFIVLYGPLGHYIAAAIQWPLSAFSPVFAFNCYVFACVVLTYGMLCACFARLHFRSPLFLLCSIFLIVGSINAVCPIAYYSLPMLLPVVAAIFTLPLAVDSTGSRPGQALLWQCLSGGLIAAELFIRINFGIYLGIAILITGVAAFLVGNRPVAIAALRCLVAAVVIACLLLGIFAVMGIARPAIADMRQYLPRAAAGRVLPLKNIENRILLIFTVISVASTLLLALGRLRRRQIHFWLVPYLLLCAFFSYSLFRFEIMHVYPLLIVSLILLFESPGALQVSKPSTHKMGLRGYFGLRELQLFTLVALVHNVGPIHTISAVERHSHALLTTQRVIPLASSKAVAMATANPTSQLTVNRHGIEIFRKEADMLDHLDRLRKPGEEIFWGSAQGSCQSTMDMCANLTLYLADGTLPRQKRWFFDTASTPYEDVQSQIVAGLEASNTPWIGMQDVYRRNTLVIAHPEAGIFSDYVKSHYVVAFTTDIPELNRRYVVYSKRLQN